ncbi:MAG: insulinase family protein, partial [Bacteroidota bacterium]
SLAKKYFGDWKKGSVNAKKFETPALPANNQVVFVDKPDAVQSVINITYPIELTPGHPDAIKVTLLRTILGGYFRSRLNENIREDKGYTYGVSASISSDPLVGSFSAGGDVRNTVTDSAIVEFLKEIELLTKEAPGKEELDLVKNVITGNFAKGMESPQSTARYALQIARFNLPKDYYQTYLQRMDAITPDDIQETAKKYLKPENAYIVVVGKKDEVADKLTRFAGSGKVTFLDPYGQPVKAAQSAGDITAEEVIAKYVKAIGGAEKLNQVKDYTMTMEANVQGQTLKVTNIKKAPGKLSIEVSVMGNVMQSTKFDGQQGAVMMMGQKQAIEGDDAAAIKGEAALFPELNYGKAGYNEISISGIEELEGVQVYVIDVLDKMGNTKKEYFNVETGVKLKSVATVNTQGQTITTTQDFSNYKAVDGIFFAHTIKTSGTMPFPIEMKVSSIELNTGVEDSVFETK